MIVTGGVAKNVGAVACVEKQRGVKAIAVPQSQMTGVLGAALLASRRLRAGHTFLAARVQHAGVQLTRRDVPGAREADVFVAKVKVC